MRSRLAVAILVICFTVQAFGAGFFEMQKVRVTVPANDIRVNTAMTKPPGNAQRTPQTPALPADQYLTLTTYTNLDNIRQSSEGLARNLQLLTFDAKFDDQVTGAKFAAPLLAYDIKSKDPRQYRTLGVDILKAYPIRLDTTETVTLTFVTSAVEKNNVDRFLNAFNVVKKVAEAIPGGGISPAVMSVMNTGATVLDQYKSSNKSYTDEAALTLNSTQFKQLEAEAIILVPTKGKPAEVDARMQKIKEASYILCKDAGGDTLCTLKNNTATPFTDFPYILVKPSVSYRISNPDFIWLKLTPGPDAVACSNIDIADAEAYTTAIKQKGAQLTAEQRSIERLLDRSTRTLLDMRNALQKGEDGRVFTLINTERTQRPAQDGLYTYVADNRSHFYVHRQLRRCMIAEANATRQGLYQVYGDLLDLLDATPPTETANQIARQERILVLLTGIQTNFAAYKIQAPEATAITNALREVAEKEVYERKFREPINTLRTAATQPDRERARQQLVVLIKDSPCGSCVNKANEALQQADAVTMAEAQAATEAAAAKTALLGTIALAEQASAATNVKIDTERAERSVERVERADGRLSTKDPDAAKDVREAAREGRDALRELGSDINKTVMRPPG